jgi:hypothetical protein
MATTREMEPIRQERTARAWHISKTNGLDETVVASACHIQNSGVLSFHNLIPRTDTPVLVRAFSPRDWRDVLLVDTPNAEPVQFPDPSLPTRRL